MKDFVLFLYALLSLSSSNVYAQSKCQTVSNNIKSLFSKEMSKRGFSQIGVGGGIRDEKIHNISSTFIVYEYLDIETARQMIVSSACELISLIHAYPESCKYFENYPNVENTFDLSILGDYRDGIDLNIVDFATLFLGDIDYCTNRRCIEEAPALEISEETFQEACMMILCEGKTRQREITCYREDDAGEVVEIGGPWGKAIKEVAISQIEQSKVRYFIKEGNEEISLIVTCEAEKSSLSTESGLKPFSQLEHKERL